VNGIAGNFAGRLTQSIDVLRFQPKYPRLNHKLAAKMPLAVGLIGFRSATMTCRPRFRGKIGGDRLDIAMTPEFSATSIG
jgi:hypothetical protein